MPSCAESNFQLLDGRILTFDTADTSFSALIFMEKVVGVFDPSGALPSDNLVAEPTFDNSGGSWGVSTKGDASQVTFATNDAHLIPQGIDPQLLLNGDFTYGGQAWTASEDHPSAEVIFSNNQCELIGGNGAADFCRIQQTVQTSFTNSQHTVQATLVGDTCKLLLGTTAGASDLLNIAAWDGTAQTFIPTGADIYLTIESDGDGATTVLDDVVISQDEYGEAGIYQEVTTTDGGSPHSIRVGSKNHDQYRVRVGTSAGDGSYVDAYTSSSEFTATFTPAGNYWITVDAYGDVSPDVTLTAIYSWFVTPTDEIGFITPYLNSEIRGLYFVPTPDANTAYVLHVNHPPYKISRDAITGVWAWTQVTFSNPPVAWTTRNQPSVGCYYQGRLWLAATNFRGQTVWGSKSSDPEDFDTGTGLPDESIEFTLANFGRIRWLIGTKNLLIGTINGEYLVTSEGGFIAPDDIQVDQQSSYGSAQVQPIQVGDQVFYVSPDGRKLRAIQYEWTKNNWLSRDLTFFSEHITESGIRSLAWSQHPDQLLWCALNDGTAACLTYERGENVYGWHRHDTQGCFREFEAGVEGGQSYLLALIQRSADELSVEVQEPDTHFDSSGESTGAGGLSTQTFTGFTHLANQVVQVLLDDAVHPDVLVAADGTITTEWEGSKCVAGLQFTPRMVTLPFDKGGEARQSGQVYYKRYDQLTVTMLDSALPIINGERRPERSPSTPMDTREPDSDGLLRTEQVTLGWSQDATVMIEQDLPLACTILSIAGRLSQEKL